MEAVSYQARREEAGLTQAEVARRTGRSRPHVANVEAGRYTPSREYEMLFLAAVDSNYEPDEEQPDLAVQPALKVKGVISKELDTLTRAADDLSKLLHAAKLAARSSARIACQTKVLLGETTVPGTYEFDPRTATSSEKESVVDFILEVMVELVIDHKFHLLDNQEIDTHLDDWARWVAREAKKRKNKSRLSGSG